MEREIIALVISAKREAARFGAQSVNFMEETDMNEFSSLNTKARSLEQQRHNLQLDRCIHTRKGQRTNPLNTATINPEQK